MTKIFLLWNTLNEPEKEVYIFYIQNLAVNVFKVNDMSNIKINSGPVFLPYPLRAMFNTTLKSSSICRIFPFGPNAMWFQSGLSFILILKLNRRGSLLGCNYLWFLGHPFGCLVVSFAVSKSQRWRGIHISLGWFCFSLCGASEGRVSRRRCRAWRCPFDRCQRWRDYRKWFMLLLPVIIALSSNDTNIALISNDNSRFVLFPT